MGGKKEEWKEKLYEPANELLSVSGINYYGEEPKVEGEGKDPLIHVQNVNLDYAAANGQVRALENINFNIYRGEFICVLGPSGCGKSTLLKILAGFIPPSDGEVRLEGELINGIDWHRGVVFQNPPLYEWYSVRDNISFGPKMRKISKSEYEPSTDEYLKRVGLQEFADKKVYELSGGMRQRVSIARALINNPEILLMDEPFGALDAFTRETMQELIRKIWWETGKTIFFITHDVEEALLLGSRVLVLSRHPGRIVDDVPVRFSRQIVEEGVEDIQFTEAFYKYRERLLKLIHKQHEN
ncbi:MAG: ABC transporter ATP-binding protein [Lachnospiraceae bacterium]|nr:ABC transporter ATP-binding protein [Lachnospiraceae bacterium]